MLVLERLQRRQQAILTGNHEKCGPGKPQRMSPATDAGEVIAQGDVYFEPGTGVPKGYVKVRKLLDKHRCLAWDTGTIGSNHKLDSLDGVEVWLPKSWGPEALVGPYARFSVERVGTHPKHGHVTIPAGMDVHFWYPRDWDAEQKAAIRAAD